VDGKVSDSLLDNLVLRGSDDWIMAADVAWIVKSANVTSSDDEIRKLSVNLVREALGRELVTIGDVTEEGFRPWDVDIDNAIQKVDRSWAELGRSPDLGEVFWLRNTERGDDRARKLMK
jgi:hypothetical protein